MDKKRQIPILERIVNTCGWNCQTEQKSCSTKHEQHKTKYKNLHMFHAGFHDVHDAAETIGEEDRAHLR